MKKRFYSIIKMFLILGILSGLVFLESVSAEEEKEVLDNIASSDVYFSGFMLEWGTKKAGRKPSAAYMIICPILLPIMTMQRLL